MDSTRHAASLLVATLAIPLLLFSSYMAAYYAMLTPCTRDVSFRSSSFQSLDPCYRVNGCDTFFRLAHRIDLRLRPADWNFTGRE